jgi:predicted DsbA family dithiol-disulfide isomerase
MDKQLVIPIPNRPSLELDLIADFACPWSYLGKRSLERALGSLYGLPQRAMRWHGFRTQAAIGDGEPRVLDTEAADMSVPTPGQSWKEHLATRLPPGISVEFAEKSLSEAGEDLGIHFDFSKLERVPDTREAHRLVALAAREEKQSEVADAIFRAFFEQGRDIGDHSVIEALAQESGLAADTLAAFNKLEEGRDEVAAEEKRLRGFGVQATPNLLINGRVLVPGPADVSTYVQALDQALFPQLPSDKKHLH